ncbi:hypothetical protein [Micromonospora sp. NPDC005299]|uniref:hypothetical protein n=1 Tax=Micromonospora sp. NPDC005299 TaxID=3364231 RepID=UPI003697B7EB
MPPSWTVGWIAAWRAVSRVRGGAAADAALAGAVHEALTTLAPARTADLDAALATTLDRLGPGAAVRAAVESGRDAARDVLAERAGDGLDLASVNRTFTPPGAGARRLTADPAGLRRRGAGRPGRRPAVPDRRRAGVPARAADGTRHRALRP